MKEVKIALLVFAVIVGSWAAITGIRLTIAHYTMENLNKSADQAIKNMTQRTLERDHRIRAEREERERRKAEIKKQEAIEKAKFSKESSNECKFWRLQSKNNPTEKTERKIKEYCSQP